MKILLLIFLFNYANTDDSIQKLPFCNPNILEKQTINNDLFIVSTLDGKISAFSKSQGVKAWDIKTEPLLSSNIHHIELTSGGKWARLIPSLSGALYRLTSESLEPLPLSAEGLLSASFKYSDDFVIAGARETHWLGVEARSGRVIYRCGSQGCVNDKERNTSDVVGELLVLRHNANTVRALDPKSGSEKWNFSVSEHQLSLSESSQCNENAADKVVDYKLSLVVPDGLVKVYNEMDEFVWQAQLDAPLAGMWHLTQGVLHSIDVVTSAGQLVDVSGDLPPLIYIGVHDQQIYIQESSGYKRNLPELGQELAPIDFKPKSARPKTQTNTALQEIDYVANALLTLYGNAQNALISQSNGYFLFGEHPTVCDKGEATKPMLMLEGDTDSELHRVHIHVSSLWFWWKEVIVIAVSSALLMNLMIWPRFFAGRVRPSTPPPLNKEYIVVERHIEPAASPEDYRSRYMSDFTPLRCLGRGGFGVVFEAKNNIDHCSYAVKRITLPSSERKRERVLREVRALAKLEHEHIVRYFNAWLEEPPSGWQETHDEIWTRELDGISLIMSSDQTSPQHTRAHTKEKTHKHTDENKNQSVMLNIMKPDLELLKDQNKRHRSQSCTDSFSVIFEKSNDISKGCGDIKFPEGSRDADDSFIVFEDSKGVGGGDLSEVVEQSPSRVAHQSRSGGSFKKKKGHRRHWSLDMCTRNTDGGDVCERNGTMYLYIQMQLCLRDSLHDWLRQNVYCNDRKTKVTTLFSQIVSAVEYVHLHGLIHRDLKPSNIFFAPDGKVKVGDFGLVTAMSEGSNDDGRQQHSIDVQSRHTYRVGTHLYMSPEQLRGHSYSYKVDIYSLGMILYELLQPFSTESERVESLLRLRDGLFPLHFTERHPEETKLLKLMLSSEPNGRPTASGVRAHAPLNHNSDVKQHFTPNHSATVEVAHNDRSSVTFFDSPPFAR